MSIRSVSPASATRLRASRACSSDSVTPTTEAPYRCAAWMAMLPQPQPTSSSRRPAAQPQLAADQVELRLLGRVQPRVRGGPDGAGVDHRRAPARARRSRCRRRSGARWPRRPGRGSAGDRWPRGGLLGRRRGLRADARPAGAAVPTGPAGRGGGFHVRLFSASRPTVRSARTSRRRRPRCRSRRRRRRAPGRAARVTTHPSQRASRVHHDHRRARGAGDRAVPPAQAERELRRAEHAPSASASRSATVRFLPFRTPRPGRNRRRAVATGCATN